MILGKKVPYMRFDEKAIKVPGGSFRPEKELGRFYGFSDHSCYERRFKPHLSMVHTLTAGIKEASEHKLGHQEGRQQVKKALETVSSAYKKRLNETLHVLSDDQDREELNEGPDR